MICTNYKTTNTNCLSKLCCLLFFITNFIYKSFTIIFQCSPFISFIFFNISSNIIAV